MNEKAIRRVYAKLPAVHCKGLCQEGCGPIMFSKAEEKMMRAAGATPPTFDDDATCTALKDGRCSIYENRPYICRLFGAHKNMVCPHGCRPERWVSDEESRGHIDSLGPLRSEDIPLFQYLKGELNAGG